MSKIISPREAASLVQDGQTLMIGGLYDIGSPNSILEELLLQNKKDLTAINEDFGFSDSPLGRFACSGACKKVILCYCGFLPELPAMADAGTIELELNPEGTLIERIRAGGYGLGGVLTRTGLGTYIEEKGYGQRMHINGEDFLYHTPLTADVTIVQAYEADDAGNLIFHGTQRNFCDMMCFAGKTVIASVATPIQKRGSLDPDKIMVPGAIVDYLVQE